MLLSIFSSTQLQFFGGTANTISFIIYIVSFVVLMFVSILWAPRIQASMVLNDVNKNLLKLQTLRENSRKELVDYVTNVCKAPPNSAPRIDQALEYFTIMPVSLDPKGIVDKIEHVVRTQDDRVRAELKTIAPQADPVQISAAQNILEVASSLNIIFKVVRHMFIQGKKTKSLFLIVQLQMTMPTLVQQAEALFNAIEAFRAAQPIGDGIGPMVAGNFMVGNQKTGIEQETVYSIAKYKDRMLYVLKAEGPMGTVGRPHNAVWKLVEDPNTKISTIIMIDAALKLEGEKTGDIAEGIGAAIGGVGVERAKIEDVAVMKNIPVYAIVVKQSLIDAISVMTKEIADSATKVVDRVHALVEDKTKEGDSILIIGVGNTLGVAQ
ncbi:MAG TPA: DUF1512 domain-containing protein [Nitrososphaerales archaeon]|nr:DUF1512 domain-containing protein [Nitrososphaerales archaeon]